MSNNRQITTQGNQQMQTNRRAAVIVGVLFITASVTAILGLLLYGPILTGPDYLVNGAAHKDQIVLGALMELILAFTAIGTAIGMFPVLKPYGERIALGHLLFRFFEAVVIAVGVIAVLSLLSVSEAFVASASPNTAAFHVTGTLLHGVYRWTSILGPLYLLGINTLMYSSLLYKSRLVPRLLAGMGMTGAVLVLGYAALMMFGVVIQGPATILVAPIGVFEMILAVWLITKGFNASAIVPELARSTTTELLSAA